LQFKSAYNIFVNYLQGEEMAVIFFDGFNRTPNLNHWTLTNATFAVGANSSLAVINANGDASNKIRLSNVGTHSNKKLYLGVRIAGYAAPHDATQSFLTFYNAAGDSVLVIKWDTNVAASDLGLTIVQGATTLTTYTILNSIASTGTVSNTGARNFFVGTGPSGISSVGRVLEFEIDLADDTIAVRYEGQSLLNSAAAELTSLATPIADIATLDIFGAVTDDYGVYPVVFDLYLLDDTGTFANTWLGSEFEVKSSTFDNTAPTFNQWNVVGGSNGSVLNSADGDTSYIRSGVFNEVGVFPVSDISSSIFAPAIAAMRVDSVSRRPSLDAAYKYAYNNGTTTFEMGSRIVLASGTYATKPAQIIRTNPNTNQAWTLSQINSGSFGVKSVDPA
jgi:hypothetical protein